MKKEICLITEWAWANRVVDRPEKLVAFVHVIFERLEKKHPFVKANKKLALEEIERDVFDCLKALSYGGRKPREISQERVDFLTEVSHSFFMAKSA